MIETLVPLSQAEQGPQDFTELIGTVELNSNIRVLATHGRTSPELATYELPKVPYDIEFTEIMRRNFTDRATYGEEDEPGVTLYYPVDKMLVKPPNPREVGDSSRDSSGVRYTSMKSGEKVDGQDNFRSADFLLQQVYEYDPPWEQLVTWLAAENGPAAYHAAIKAAYLKLLETSDVPVVIFDIHDTSEWGIASATEERATDMVYRTDKDGWSAGFPLAILSDMDGQASGRSEYVEVFQESLVSSFKEVGVEPGKKHVRLVPVDVSDPTTEYTMVKTPLWGDVEVNSRFKGGFVTKLLGVDLRDELIKNGRQDLAEKIAVFQVELNRSDMLDDVTQKIDPAAAYIQSTVLAKAMNYVSDRITKDYLAKAA